MGVEGWLTSPLAPSKFYAGIPHTTHMHGELQCTMWSHCGALIEIPFPMQSWIPQCSLYRQQPTACLNRLE